MCCTSAYKGTTRRDPPQKICNSLFLCIKAQLNFKINATSLRWFSPKSNQARSQAITLILMNFLRG